MATTTEFLTDIKTLRMRARKHMEQGAVTEGYQADLKVVLRLLNEALATEIVCVLRYKRHHFMAKGIHAQAVAAEFLEHANEEQGHADLIAARIVQLGGSPDFSPQGLLSRSHSEYAEGDTLVDMIREDLVAERIAIDSYGEMVRYIGAADSTTRRMLEGILAMEEEHADDLANLLDTIDPTKEGKGQRSVPQSTRSTCSQPNAKPRRRPPTSRTPKYPHAPSGGLNRPALGRLFKYHDLGFASDARRCRAALDTPPACRSEASSVSARLRARTCGTAKPVDLRSARRLLHLEIASVRCRRLLLEETNMLSTILVILVVMWLLGMVSSYTMGGFIHLLLVLAIAVVLIRVIQGRPAF